MTWNHNSTDFDDLGQIEQTPRQHTGRDQTDQNMKRVQIKLHRILDRNILQTMSFGRTPTSPDHRCPPTTDLLCVKDGIQHYNLIDMVVHEWLKKCSKSGCVHNLRFFKLYLQYFVSTFYIKVFLLYLFLQTFFIRFHKLRVDYISASLMLKSLIP